MNESRQQIAVIVICISLTPEVVLCIAVHLIPISHQAAVLQVVIIIKLQQEAIYHRTIAVQRKAIHMTHTMMAMMIYTWMAMMIYTWMAIMIMTGIVIMPMVWMTQWMNLTRSGKYGRQIVKKRSRIDIILDGIKEHDAENMA